MKSNIFIVLSIVFFIIYSGCSENFLEEKPQEMSLETDYWINQDDFLGALIGVVEPISGAWGGYSMWMMVYLNAVSDDVQTYNAQGFPFAKYNFTTSDENVLNMWLACYEGIMRANQILEKIRDKDFELKERIIGEAKFWRAFLNWHLVVHWGEAPLLYKQLRTDNEIAAGGKKASKQEIWEAIEEDLNDAYTRLPESYNDENLGRPTNGAAAGLLGKSYLYMATDLDQTSYYQKAAEQFEIIINSQKYRLVDNFELVNSIKNENNEESLIEIQYIRAGSNPWYRFGGTSGAGQVKNFLLSPIQAGGQAWFAPKQELVDEYEENDSRFMATIYSPGDSLVTEDESVAEKLGKIGYQFKESLSPTGYGWKKNLEPIRVNEQGGGFGDNYIWLRLADIYLMYAECVVLGNAVDNADWKSLCNDIRQRAGLSTSVEDWLNENPGKSEMDYIKHERRLELALEYHRFRDLVRWGDAEDKLGEKGFQHPKHNYLPIPQNDIDLSEGNLTQNEYWK